MSDLARLESYIENFSTVLLGKCDQVLLRCMSEYEIQLYRDVVSTLLEKSLLRIDPKLIPLTERKLRKYNLTFNDALENPETIFFTLHEILESDYPLFIQSINDEMSLISKNNLFEKFLNTLNK